MAPLPQGAKHSLQVLHSVLVRVTLDNSPRQGVVEWFSLPVVHVRHHLHLQLRSQLLGSKRIHVNLAPWRRACCSSLVLGADMIVSTDPSRFTLRSGGWRTRGTTASQTSRDPCPQQTSSALLTEVGMRPAKGTVANSRSLRVSRAQGRKLRPLDPSRSPPGRGSTVGTEHSKPWARPARP